MNSLMRVDKLSGSYAKKEVIKDVSFNIERGQFLGIIGPNGSGKSTLLKLMSKALRPTKGMVLFENKNTASVKLKELSQKIAFVPQDTAINFSFTVWEIVLMGRIPHLGRFDFETKEDFRIAEEALSLTDTSKLKESLINELSAGERQLVIVAKALAQKPILLFLDEPTSHLDIGHQLQILNLLKTLNKRNNLTIIMVMHDLNLAGEYCDKLILLQSGQIYQQGSPEKVLIQENIAKVYKAKVLVKANPVSHKPLLILNQEGLC